MTVLSHVHGMAIPRRDSLEDMLEEASRLLVEHGIATEGDPVVFVAGVPPGITRSTNVMKLHRIGEPLRLS